MEPVETQLSSPQKTAIEEISAELESADAEKPIEKGPYGALVLVTVAVCLLFLGWLFFYFVLFMRRGYIG